MSNDAKIKLPIQDQTASPQRAKEFESAPKHLPTRLLIVALMFTALMLGWTIWSSYDSYRESATVRVRLLRIETLRGEVVHLDEVLTMSARMAAATGDVQWDDRYRKFEPQLDSAITELRTLAPSLSGSQFVAETDASNRKLVELEHRALTLVRQGQPREARSLLFSVEYETLKSSYAESMTQLVGLLEAENSATLSSKYRRALLSSAAGLGVFLFSLIGWLAVIRSMSRSYAALSASIAERQRVEEILRNAQRELEVRVQERTAELTRANASLNEKIAERARIELELIAARDTAIESTRLKAEFLANMSHEIRTPMNGVIGMTGLLLDTELDTDQRDFAETIRSSGDALLTIINDILDFSKIEAGKVQFDTVDFDLSNAVEGTIELLAEQADEKKIEFASFIHSDLPTLLQGDPGRLRQVLTNLTGNALKFTEHGEVIVSAEKEFESESTVVIRFSVKDTGIGISDETQKKLFNAFTQADGSTTRKYGGTGLGLSISKQLVEMMDGQIGVSSIAGEGSTFWFTARFAKQPATAVITASNIETLDKLRVLVVDDNATNRKILAHQLTSWGMIYQEADSAARALTLLSEAAVLGTPYDLAILDLLMPVMDGFELARAIKADSQIASTRLVLLTSAGQRGDGLNARETGIAAYLTKPVKQSQLFDCLITVLTTTPNAAEARATSVSSSLVTRHTMKERNLKSHKLVLLAEDNIVNQKVAVRQLLKLGYRADVVANGKEALEALGRISYDLVFMDCQMPEMDGYAASREIRRVEGETKHTPIVAMTAHALQGDREKCMAAGMDDYVSKPVKVEGLIRVLDAFFATVNNDEAGAATEVPAVDVVRMHEAMGDQPEEYAEILEAYLSQMSENLEKLDVAFGAGDYAQVELIAHNCCGTSANCGMTAVVAPLRELETAGREKRLAAAAPLIAETKLKFERVREFLMDHTLQPA